MTIVHLRRAATSLVLDARGPGLPRVAHWAPTSAHSPPTT